MWSVSVGIRWQGARDGASHPSPVKAAAAAAAAVAGRAAAAAAAAGAAAGGGGASAGGGREGRGSRGGVAAMLYYTLDPQFGALLYSVASRYERLALLPDALACCAYAGPPAPTEVLAYAHALGIQLYTFGENYACFLTQVRAGSVIFLVGVGSLVCWKLWEHWRSGGGPSSPPPSPTHSPTPPQRRPRSILASLLEDDLVQDFEDFDDEDPALIHHLIELGREYLAKLLVGQYFGPDSPCGEGPGEDLSLVSSEVSEVSEVFAHHYLADASASISAGDVGSSSGENSLPTDEDSDVELFGGHKRVVRRKHRSSEIHRNQLTPSHGRATGSGGRVLTTTSSAAAAAKKHKAESKNPAKRQERQGTCQHPLQEDWGSSESSPGHGAPTGGHLPQVKELTRHLGDGSETPDSEELVEKRRHQGGLMMRPSQTRDQEDWLVDSRLQPEGEEESHISTNISSASLSDLMEKMRHRGCRGSISRDNSIASNMSDFVTSPQGSKRFTFKREDSVCSNLSDFAPSECSEMSLDVSVRDDLACKTFTYLDDIEHELDDLKSSMLEMDEEVTKFSSKPNPYTFKTTFSDYSITSGDSRPSSALDLVNAHRSRASFRGILGQRGAVSSDSEAIEGGPADASHTQGHVVSGSEAEGSFEWDSPQHGWSSARGPPLSRLPELPSEDAESSRASTQEDMMPSLEWDNDCLQQYDEEQMQDSHSSQLDEVFHRNTCESFAELEGYEEYKLSCSRHQLLPDHSSLELDLEEELLAATSPLTEAADLRSAPMTISVDSAIHSATGSRSASSSPLPTGLGQSLLSSSGLASSSEISPATPDSESAGWASWERRLGPGEFGSKARRYWSSEESGYMEGTDTTLDTAVHAHLSPVHEINREKEYSESSGSSPTHRIDTRDITNEGGNLNETALESNLNGNLIMGSTASTANDNERILGTTATFGSQPNVAVGQRVEVARYASQEWRGNTAKAHTIKQGYSAIPVELNYHYLRRVRGDNYCGVRAALYQVLSMGLPVPSGHATHTRLAAELNQGSTWLQDWSFGQRLSFSKEQVLNGFWECLEALDSMVLSLTGCENKECVVLSRINSDPLLDVKLCEAVKLHMLATALDLHIGNNNGDNVPLFAMIMFARHTSLTPRDFVKNHLNLVGDTAGLEQDQHKIEMFLMGHTLGVTLQVVRPACYGKDDFICYYPDANIGIWPEVTLVAEDDRHYNVLIK
ncbi:uncharacterized protein LOC122247622 isoform X3 [Penaeus japonicus]|uniref:uncharacterized protein LOC122247622 isoform X3 n=1 Tax=Penaeus japonicus TaxID=27405 RepID=UPI001C70BD3B|nr:uncharacterized protein LOC122247622 isoform X3 [Penaeus japonicus]